MTELEYNNEIGDLIRKTENDYVNGMTTLGKYVEFSQYENIEKIDAYLNSKHTSGDTDSRGRDKPFFNIVTAAVNIWYRATTIGRTKIRIKATKKEQTVLAFIATLLIQDWMRKNNFDAFLNKWDLTQAKYGSAIVEFVEQQGKLTPSVLTWNRTIIDTVDFENNPRIKILWLTPAQLRKNKLYDQDMVKALLDAQETRKTSSGQNKDSKAGYIKVYELHGELELCNLTDQESDKDEYVQQIQVVSFVKKEGRGNHKKYDDYILYRGKEKNPHMITHLIEEDGRSQSVGSVEHLFEPQWMVNHSAKQMKDYLDFASSLFFQTSDATFVGQNVLDAVETGDILTHAVNAPLTLVNTVKADITAIQNFSTQWQIQGKEIVSTPDAISGNTQPSGTPFRSLAVENKEAHSLFEVMKRNKKRDLERMMREYVIPFNKKLMDTSEEIAALLETQDITTLDAIYVPDEAIRRENNYIKNTVLSGQEAQNLDRKAIEANIQDELSKQGNQRFIKPSEIATKTWKQVLEDFEWECEVEIEDKTTDDQLVADSLVDYFKVLTNPAAQAFLATPMGKVMNNKILEKINAISPLELAQVPAPQPVAAQQQAPSVGGSGAVQQPVGQPNA